MTYAEYAQSVQQRLLGLEWNTADHIQIDEVLGMIAEKPPFGSDTHRWISTYLNLLAAK